MLRVVRGGDRRSSSILRGRFTCRAPPDSDLRRKSPLRARVRFVINCPGNRVRYKYTRSLTALSGCGGGTGPQSITYCGTPGGTPGSESLIWDSGVYAYDGAGNIQSIGVNTYQYDALSRLKSATILANGTVYQESFQYDPFGSMTQTARTVNGTTTTRVFGVNAATNRLQSQAIGGGSPIPYQFDENGSMTLAGTTAYTLTSDGRLDKISTGVEGQVARYDYDANGYRVRAEADGMEIFYFRDGSGQVLSEFQRLAGGTSSPIWNKDYIYALGKSFSLIKNDIPATPQKPIATSVSASTVVLAWEAVNEPDLLGYKLDRYRNDDTSPTSWTLTPETLAKIDGSFSSAAKLRYKLYAMDEAGNVSSASPELLVRPTGSVPPTPTGLTGTALDRRVELQWISVTADDLRGYIVQRCMGTGCTNFLTVNPFPTPLTTFTDAGLLNGTTYTYQVRAVDTSNRQSGPSDPPLERVPRDLIGPAKPVGVLAVAPPEGGGINVAWDRNLDDDLAGYRVYRSGASGSLGTLLPGACNWVVTPGRSCLDPSPTVGSLNYYTVVALDTSNNTSDPSNQASARPRNGSAPTGLSAQFEINDNGTPELYPADVNTCETDEENDDFVQVKLTWTAVAGATYRIYRRATGEADYVSIGTSTTSPSFDVDPPGDGFVYFVATVFPSGEESIGSNEASAIDLFNTSVRNVIVRDGRDHFNTKNAPGRSAWVYWSEVKEKNLRGYHVYRRCARRDGLSQYNYACPFGVFFTGSGGAEGDWCESRWVRLTEAPLSASTQFYEDTSLAGLEGCYTYLVRPVSSDPPLLEGPVSKAATFYGVFDVEDWPIPHVRNDNLHCIRNEEAWDRFVRPPSADPEHPELGCGYAVKYPGSTCINSAVRGTGSAAGAPATPSGVGVGKEGCNHHPYWNGCGENCTPDLYRELKGHMIAWTKSPESDLKGYYIEKAGSALGPWKRITPHAIAWWETSYCVGAAAVQILNESDTTPGSWSGTPRCAHYRLIAVDEEGNESAPQLASEGVGGPTTTECPVTPNAPPNLHVLTPHTCPNTPCQLWGTDCQVTLEWNKVVGNGQAIRYNVYRFVTTAKYSPHFFYKTAEFDVVPGSDNPTFTEVGDSFGDACPYGYDSGGSRCHTGNLEAYYVTAQYRQTAGGPLGGESPPSNIVFYDCSYNDAQGGYVRTLGAPIDDFLAETGPRDDSELVCRDESLQLDLSLSIASQSASSVAPVSPLLLRAPMASLGAFNPPWSIQDLHTDHLGSVRVIANDDGDVVSRHDYFPFGEEAAPMVGVYNTHAFTGHERDGSGLDYMLARYYGANLARFLSTDPLSSFGRNLRNAQRWNRYSYTLNNPLRYFDPNGKAEVEVTFRAFIRQESVGIFRGDNRGFSADRNASSRTSVTVKVETDP